MSVWAICGGEFITLDARHGEGEESRDDEGARKSRGQAANADPLAPPDANTSFAPAFLEFKRLLASSGAIEYGASCPSPLTPSPLPHLPPPPPAVVRDLIGPNSIFVSQSSTFPQKAHDVPSCAAAERASLAEAMSRSFLGETKCTSSRLVAVHRLLGSLGSHDLSLMREAFGGVPTRCESAWANGTGDFMGAQFVYARRGAGGQAEGEFRVSYETGIHNVGGEFLSARGSGEQRCEKAARAESSCNERQVFDAFIEVFTRDRVLKIQCTSLSLPPPPHPSLPNLLPLLRPDLRHSATRRHALRQRSAHHALGARGRRRRSRLVSRTPRPPDVCRCLHGRV
jgi:hypothetical protein